jgi:4-hydroxy-tetrahydrodipicolinate reductase
MGASGRMGRMLIDTIAESDGAHLIAVTERAGTPGSGRIWARRWEGPYGRAGLCRPARRDRKGAGGDRLHLARGDVAHAQLTAQARCVHVIGTTGFSDADIAALDAAARHATIVRAGNMSLGVNLLTRLVQQVAAALDTDFDIEVVEKHHRHKVDAPSGTALMLGEAAARGAG